jgi:GNAT superfamily N-acetyltransferase
MPKRPLVPSGDEAVSSRRTFDRRCLQVMGVSVMRQSALIIRPLVPADIPQVARWNTELHEDEGTTPMSNDAAENRLRRWLETGRFQAVVFVVEDKEIGYLLYELRPVHDDQRSSESVYLRQFFISRDSRRRGLGTAAINTFLREIIPSTARLVLEVKTSNPAGHQFWLNLGFESVSTFYELTTSDSE